jgi:hypothetical protein
MKENTMKKTLAHKALPLALTLLSGGTALAADTATQDLNITVAAVNEITVGSTVTLNINTATAGQIPTGTATSSYAITTNSATSRKITAELDEALQSGLTLSANMAAPSTGTSAGETALSVTASDVVTSIEAVAQSGITINYSATAAVSVATGTYPADVVYTIVAD